MTPTEFRAIRKSLGLSARAFAEALGFADGRYIRAMESGQAKVQRRTEMLVERLVDQALEKSINSTKEG